MKSRQILIKFVKKWKIEEILKLYKAGGWWEKGSTPLMIKKIISGSFIFAVAVEKTSNTAIGMGRVLSDGISDAYIHDVIIFPRYRHQGIGKNLIKAMVKHCLSKGIDWIALITDFENNDFYKRSGFQKMKNNTAMKYKKV